MSTPVHKEMIMTNGPNVIPLDPKRQDPRAENDEPPPHSDYDTAHPNQEGDKENVRRLEPKRPRFATYDGPTGYGPPGLYWHGGTDKEPRDIWVCSPIHAIALTSGEHGHDFGLLIRFRDSLFRWREWAMPRAMLKGSGEELRGELLSMGMRTNTERPRLLNTWLMAQEPECHMLAMTRTGWCETRPKVWAFVLPHVVIGSDDVRFQSEYAAHDDFTQKGTLDGWKAEVAELCRLNPILLLSVSTAFAGPLMKVAKQQDVGGIGIHLMGDSSKGKSTAQEAAVSVWGAPGFKRSWNATGNGLEATAAARNDSLLVLDEISECDPRDIGGIVYALANGTGKQRARRTGGVREAARWRVAVLSSGERSLAAHMSEGGKRAKAGQEARLLDVPATNRRHGAFDDLHGRADGRAFADELKQASVKNYGHAGPAFVKALLADTRDLPALYAETCTLPDFRTADGVESRAAGAFALVGMAGELAIEYGIVPWAEDEAMGAAIEAFKAWRAFRGDGPTEQRQILQAVREFCERYLESRFTPLSSNGNTVQSAHPIRDRAGYVRASDDGRPIFLFYPHGLTEAAQGHDLSSVLMVLDEAGWLPKKQHGYKLKATVDGVRGSYYGVCIADKGGEDAL